MHLASSAVCRMPRIALLSDGLQRLVNVFPVIALLLLWQGLVLLCEAPLTTHTRNW